MYSPDYSYGETSTNPQEAKLMALDSAGQDLHHAMNSIDPDRSWSHIDVPEDEEEAERYIRQTLFAMIQHIERAGYDIAAIKKEFAAA